MKNRILGAATAAVFIPQVLSADTAVLRSGEDWSRDLTFYFYLPTSTEGTSTVAGNSVPVDLDLSDALDLLDFAISGRFEAWRGDFGFVADANYLSLEASGSGPFGAVTADVDVEQYWLGLLGAYRAAKGRRANGSRYSVDLQAGVRYNNLKQTVDLDGPGPGLSIGGTETWWEPVIGARYVTELNERWSTAFAVDAGGFGVNGSDLQWSATWGFNYALQNAGSIKLGIRYYSIDFSTTRSDGEFGYDVEQFGPFFGYTFEF
ncbi:MAG: hypothetical protein QNI90_01725 [Dinoroseobacter sp.]|nr:hypothetical protein [Dinoroseobacter sp.]